MSMQYLSSSFAADCLQGRQILITGGSGALGQAMVSRLLAHGAKVLNMDPTAFPLDLQEPLRSRLTTCHVDITNEEDVSNFFSNSCLVDGESFVPDTVICHAGVVLPGAFDSYSYADWKRTFDLNLNGHFLVSRAAVPLLERMATADNPARILFTSSWVGQIAWPGNGAYSPSKAAVDMLAKGLSRELASRHIRVNILSPGIVGAGMALKQWQDDATFQQRAKLAIPVGHLQSADSVSDATLFLCSRASDYMTGSTLVVDGGASIYPMI
jgi:NAD(P)-dependent dehydrogenase (short-subunit alcohol dehydrogenase family)